ncbi:ethanolamine permease [Leptospira kobayashii]|uniref:Ethanolamine permease n=1 Tax=Leptospira kobayashii TaxID=1917830 RepID=A0ABN6KBB2_9LEPT|nr:ethanolamine permease [Leptospira kobayashii]BDA77544.1 ethanolamine permease [Leptospira kobayashii]
MNHPEQSQSKENSGLHKTLGPIHLWGIAVGLVISGDYFGWNLGWSVAGFWEFALAVFIIAVFYICFALCFTELAASIPHSGGPFAYSHLALGKIGGFISGFLVLAEFILAPPAIASALGGYFHFLFPVIPDLYASFGFFGILVIINLLGVKQTARFELFVTITAICGLLLYLGAILPYFSFQSFAKLPAFAEFSLSSFFQSIPFAIWFFLAVEGVAMAAEEVKDPKKDIPKGYAAGIGTLIFLASSIFIGTAGVVPTKEVAGLDYPLSFVLTKLYGTDSYIAKIFTFIGLFGLIASLFGIILGSSRLVYALSKEKFLPGFLGKLNHKTHVPVNAVFVGAAIGFLALCVGKTSELITASALGACGMYVVSMISFFVLRKKEPNRSRPYVAPFYPVLAMIALVLGLVALVSVIYSNPFVALLLFVGFAVSTVGFMLWGRRGERKQVHT